MEQKRIKSSQSVPNPIKNWELADQFVRRIGDQQEEIQLLEKEAKDKINQIKKDLQGDVRERHQQIKIDLDWLEDFAAAHVEDFGKAKSKKLDFGRLGWRQSTAIRIAPKKTLDLIRQFPAHIRKLCIRTKEKVNKDGLATLTDEQLAKVKAQRKVTEVFFVEPSFVEAVDNS